MRALSSPHVQSTFRQRANPAARERAPSPPPLLDGPLPVLNFFGSSLSRNDSAADLVTLSRSRSHSHGSSPYSSPTYGAAFASRVPSWHRLDEEDAESPPAAAAAVVLSVPLPASDPSTPTADATTPPPPTADAPLPPMRPAVVAALCLAQMAHFYSMCSIFSYAGFLAADSGWVSTPDRAGYVAGLLATMLPLGRLPTSMLWGQYADAAGRRPALIGSMLGIAVGNLAFGFARSLWAALAVRFVLLGGCNGWNSVLGPICAEVGGPRSSLLLGYVFGAGGVINLVGPAVGGLAYGYWGRRPEDHPALLPSLIGAALGATACAAAWLWVPETLPSAAAGADDNERRANTPSSEEADAADAAVAAAEAAEEAAEARREAIADLGTALRAPPLPAIIALRTGIGLAAFASYDVVPLWAIASARAGGLNLGQQELGALLSCAAAVQLLWTTLLMARVFDACGVRRVFAGACAAGAAALLLLPLARAAGAPFAVVAVLIAGQSAALNTACTASVAHTNNACCAFPSVAGAINGVVVTVESLAKACGPSVGAPLFAFAIEARPADAGEPSGALLAFSGLAIFVAAHLVGGVLFLPRRIDEPLPPL